MKTTDFYSSATGTLRVNGGRDENAPQGVSLSIDDLSYIKQGSRANEGNTGTSDYNDLTNKPLVNSVELKGNKSLNDLGIQPKIDSSHKVLADNIDDTDTTNKFATAAQLSQIATNQTNILSVMTPNKGIITFENAYTPNNYQAHIRQYNNIVVGQLYIKFDTALPVTSPATVIAHLSDIAFPATYSRFMVGVSTQLWEVPTSEALLLIDTNGDIAVLPATGESKTAYICNFAYAITDPT
jgi:hypothetical protein